MVEIKFKKLTPAAETPQYANDGDACFDLTAVKIERNDKFIEYFTGIAVEIPKSHVGLIFPRSSVTKKDLMLKNSVGVIDSGYRGEIRFRFKIDTYQSDDIYKIGDRIGQMMILPIPQVKLTEVKQLSDSERGEGGWGSTGE